jgi:hypothetical protein
MGKWKICTGELSITIQVVDIDSGSRISDIEDSVLFNWGGYNYAIGMSALYDSDLYGVNYQMKSIITLDADTSQSITTVINLAI